MAKKKTPKEPEQAAPAPPPAHQREPIRDALPIGCGDGRLVIATRYGDGLVCWIDPEGRTEGSFPDSLRLIAAFISHLRCSNAASFNPVTVQRPSMDG